MVYHSFTKRIKWLAGAFLLCVSVSCVCGISPAHAQGSAREGFSGTCTWRYEPLSMGNEGHGTSYKLTIFPSSGEEPGILEDWVENHSLKPSWCADYYPLTTCIEIKKAPDGSKPVKARTCQNMFDSFPALTSADLSGLDVAGVTDMQKMFHHCRQLDSLNLRGWDTSSVTTMYGMFQGCAKLNKIDGIENWNTSNVIDMRHVFERCSSLTELDLSGWSTSSNTDTTDMFGTANKFRSFTEWESLSYLVLGEKFHFRGSSGLRSPAALKAFSDDGRFHWIQVNLGENGIAKNPKGRTFHSLDELVKFHNGRQEGSGPEAYVCAGFGRMSSRQHGETSIASRSHRSNRHAPEFIGEPSVHESSVQGPCIQEPHMQEPRTQESSVQGPSMQEPRTQESSMQVPCTQESSMQVPESPVRPEMRELGIQEPETHELGIQETRTRESSTAIGEDELMGWRKHDNMVFYYRDARKLTGWQRLSGTIQNPLSSQENWFYFDDAGVMLTGRQKLFGGFKNAQGVQEQHWFALDGMTGAQIRYWQRVVGSNGETWYYHRPEDGSGLLGKQQVVGGFANARGVHELNWFYFDVITGAEMRGWHKIEENGVERWYYYRDGDGIMLKGQHRLPGGDSGGMNWFYFDEATGAELRNCWKEIPSQGKTCYYGPDGAMYKGWRKIGDRNWYFDKATGALL